MCAQVMVSASAVGSDGTVFEEPGEPDARGPGDEDGKRDRVYGVAGAERVQAEQTHALFERVESGTGGDSGSRGRGRGDGATDCGQQLGQRRARRGREGCAGQQQFADYNEVGPGFFGKMGIPLIAGREFRVAIRPAGPTVAMVNETFVKRFLDGRNPIGVRFTGRGTGAEIRSWEW